MTDPPARRWTDTACVALLLVLSYVLFLRHAPNIPNSRDGFTYNFLVHEGFLGYFNWEPAKIAGRPFVGMSYCLARDLLGGSVVAQAVFQLTCFTITALAVYVIVRLLVPRFAVLAWAAGVLKLTWSFHAYLLVNTLINVVFSEMLFALALLGLVFGAGRRSTVARRLPLAAGIGVFIFIATGTYQSLWPPIILVPLALIPRVRRIGAAGWTPFVAWYASFAAAAVLSIVNLRAFPNKWLDLDAGRILLNWMIGARTVFVDGIWRPAAVLVESGSIAAGVTAAVVTAVFVIVGLRLLRRDGDPRQAGTWTTLAWLGFGVALVLAALLPPSVKNPAVYGSRFANHAIWGWIIVTLSLATLALRSRRRIVRAGGGVFVAGLVLLTTAAWGVWMRDMSEFGAISRVRYVRVMEHAAGIEEGTVVFVSGRRHETDSAATTHLRMLSDTFDTFWLHDAEVTPDGDQHLLVDSTLVLSRTREDIVAMDIAQWAKVVRRPIPFAGTRVHRSRIDVEQRVTLRWSPAFNQYIVDETLSNTGRLRGDAVSAFGRVLYPRARHWMGGSFVLRGAYDVLARDGAAARRVYRHYDWYPPSCGLAAARSERVREDGSIAVDGAGAWIRLYVPPGRPLAFAFAHRGSSPALHAGLAAATWSEPCAASPRTWRTPPLDPGFHALLLRADAGTTIALDAFTLQETVPGIAAARGSVPLDPRGEP